MLWSGSPPCAALGMPRRIRRPIDAEGGFYACPQMQNRYERAEFGLWRSLVARPSGGRKVAGSSPASPTIQTALGRDRSGRFCVFWESVMSDRTSMTRIRA